MASQKRLEDLFTDEAGESIGFYIHESVKEEKREKVIKAIKKHGGKVVDTDLGVDTVVVDPWYPAAYTLQNKYRVHSDQKYWRTTVEGTEFVFNCIKLENFEHKPVERQPMRGKRPGRVEYTEQDDKRLCRYLAIRTPNIESGGRLGHRIYEELVDLGTLDPQEYSWALRHPPESWREHYRIKKNRSRLDAMIRRYVRKLNPREEQLYPFDRRLNRSWPSEYNERKEPHPQENFDEYWQHRERNKRLQKKLRQEEEESSDEEPEAESSNEGDQRPSSLFSVDEEADGDGAPDNLGTRNVSIPRRVPNEPDNSQATLVGQSNAYKSPIRPSQVSGGAAPPQTDEEHLDDADEGERRPRFPSPDATAVAARAESPQMSVPPVVSNPVQDLIRRTRRAAQAAPAADAPYRNTRARSVEAPPPINELQTRGRKRNVVVESSLSPPAEAEEDYSTRMMPNRDRIGGEAEGGDLVPKSSRSKARKRPRIVEEESPVDNNQEPISVPETLHEEADVARMLVVQSVGSSGSTIQQQQQPTRGQFSESGKSRNPGLSRSSLDQSMDTDDEQIDKKLNSSNVPQWAKAHDPLDLLEGFNNSRTSGRHSLATSSSSSARTARLLLLPQTENAEHTDDELPVTPSESSFPLPGTRANVAKKRYEEERKKEEYIPPPSSRAAKSKRTSGK